MKTLLHYTGIVVLVITSFISMSFKTKQPIKGWRLYEIKPKTYHAGIDSIDGRNTAYIISDKAKSGASGTLFMETFKADKYLGKRIRLSADIKTQDVKGWAALGMTVVSDSSSIWVYRSDGMKKRHIEGTTNWKRYDIILDVPKNGITISVSFTLDSTGKAYMANLKLEEVDTTIACTGHNFTQKKWQVLNQKETNDYVGGLDSLVLWNGSPAYYCKAIAPKAKSFGFLGKFFSPISYLDKKIKITAYIKTSDIKKGTFYSVSVDYLGKGKVENSHWIRTKLKPNQDWTKYETVAYVPANTYGLEYFIGMDNRGEVWVNDFKIEVVDDKTPTSDKKEKKYPAVKLYDDQPTLTFVANK